MCRCAANTCHRNGGLLLQDLALGGESTRRQFVVMGLGKKGIETAAMLDGTQRRRRHAKTDIPRQHVGNQRDVAEIRQETRPGLVMRVADLIAGLYSLAGQFAAARHDISFKSIRKITSLGAYKL